ncbi:hypothetical protein U1Q18_008813 [Sarracenia purpurea var. burkii]
MDVWMNIGLGGGQSLKGPMGRRRYDGGEGRNGSCAHGHGAGGVLGEEGGGCRLRGCVRDGGIVEQQVLQVGLHVRV